MRILRILFILSIYAQAFALSFSKDDDTARDNALQWLQVVDSGNYQDAVLQMAQEVRGSRDWANYFATRRRPLGRVIKRQIAEVRHASTIPGLPQVRSYVVLRFKTAFERKTETTEEITLAKMGCCWEVCGYEVN